MERATLAQLRTPKEELPPADAKPVFRSVLATAGRHRPRAVPLLRGLPREQPQGAAHAQHPPW